MDKNDLNTLSFNERTKNFDEYAQFIIARFLPEICLQPKKYACIKVINKNYTERMYSFGSIHIIKRSKVSNLISRKVYSIPKVEHHY